MTEEKIKNYVSNDLRLDQMERCPYCGKEIVVMRQRPTVVTLEEFQKMVRADVDAYEARRKAKQA
jgi:DNA-directed RNA polymerase subunit RPC12/RpoP